MAISNSIDFTVSRDDIITEALEQLGVLGEGESPTADQLTSCSRTLNMLIKTWQADGLNLFAVTRQYLFPLKTQQEYSLSSTSTDHFTESFSVDSLTATLTAGNDTITISDTTGMTVGTHIGFDQGSTILWTTVAVVLSSTQVEISDLYSEDIVSGTKIYWYSTTAPRPMKIMEGYVRSSTSTDIPLGHLSRRKYNQLSDKSSVGLTNQFYYDPQIGTGNLFIWPTATDENNYLTFFVQRTLSDLDSATDNPEIPQEWYLPLALNLAVELSPKYGTPDNTYYRLAKRAQMYYDMCKGFDNELYTSVYFTPDTRGEDL